MTQRPIAPGTPMAKQLKTESVTRDVVRHGPDEWTQVNRTEKRSELEARLVEDRRSKDNRMVDVKAFKRLCRRVLEGTGYRVMEDRVDLPSPSRAPLDFLISGPEGLVATLCAPFRDRAVSVSVVRQLQSSMAANKALRGMIVTSGRFSSQAIEYADAISALGSPVELVDGGVLAEMAARAGIELTVENEPAIWTYGVSDTTQLHRVLGSFLDNLYESSPRSPSKLMEIHDREITLRPSFKIRYDVEASVRGRGRDGVLDRISVRDGTLFLDGEKGTIVDPETSSFFESLEPVPYSVVNFREVRPRWIRFGSESKGIAARAKVKIAEIHASSGTWWGNRGNLYYGTWKPSARNITVTDIAKIYLPENKSRFRILRTVYEVEFLEHPSGLVKTFGRSLETCMICDQSIRGRPIMCNACGKIAHRRKHGFHCKSCGRTLCLDCVRFKKGFLLKAQICVLCENDGRAESRPPSEIESHSPKHLDRL